MQKFLLLFSKRSAVFPPMNTPSLLSQAATLLRAGRPAEAIWKLRQAAQAQPANATILHDLGLACLECGALDDAIAALQRAVAIDPHYADAHLRLGIALEAAGALDAALTAYLAASSRPAVADARYRAGNLLETLGRTAQAAQAFRRAASSAPKTTLGRIATARALLNENRDAEAQKTLRHALALDKTNAVARELLGQTLADAGRFEAAREALLHAIELSPSLAGSYYDVVRCRRITAADAPLVARMQAALAWPGLEPAQRSRLQLALGKAAHDTGDYAEAMRQYDAAEQARNTILRFDPAAFAARVNRLIATFTPELFAQAAPQNPGAEAPLLIVGLPRSGTTLVEQILSCHPNVTPAGELPFWNTVGAAWENAGALTPDRAFLQSAAAGYTAALRAIAPQGQRVTDKMPLNFQWAGLIHLAFPAATIIHCHRNPIATALSIHQTHFNPRTQFPTGGAALVNYMRAAERLCDHWRAVLPSARFIDVEYESLVSNPAKIIPELLAACALPPEPACLRPELNQRVIKTPSKWQARQPINNNAAESWRAYEPFLGPLTALLE
jgi:tetratricopeptide (TPR) repeat protein